MYAASWELGVEPTNPFLCDAQLAVIVCPAPTSGLAILCTWAMIGAKVEESKAEKVAFSEHTINILGNVMEVLEVKWILGSP